MDLQEEIRQLHTQAGQKRKEHLRLVQQLKKMKPFDVDELFHTEHETVFEEIDCLDCGNCCRTTPALLLHEDISTISKHLRMSAAKFMDEYVRKDEDGDFVFKHTPCSFLNADNYCSIYEVRPNACREYPHTHQKKMTKILDLTLTNAGICPAVARILDRLEETLL